MDKQKTRLATMQILFFYIEMNTSNTFYSSTNETKVLLASLTTILESLYVNYKESSIKNPNFLKALSISSKSCFVSASTK